MSTTSLPAGLHSRTPVTTPTEREHSHQPKGPGAPPAGHRGEPHGLPSPRNSPVLELPTNGAGGVGASVSGFFLRDSSTLLSESAADSFFFSGRIPSTDTRRCCGSARHWSDRWVVPTSVHPRRAPRRTPPYSLWWTKAIVSLEETPRREMQGHRVDKRFAFFKVQRFPEVAECPQRPAACERPLIALRLGPHGGRVAGSHHGFNFHFSNDQS